MTYPPQPDFKCAAAGWSTAARAATATDEPVDADVVLAFPPCQSDGAYST